MKTKVLLLLPVAVAAICLAQPVFANVTPTLTLTEVSNTQLDYAWDVGNFSGSITTMTPDQWLNTFISGPTLSGLTEATDSWTEPGGGSHNFVDVAFTPTGWEIVTVISDVTGNTLTPDGTVRDFFDFRIVFFDKGDAASGVPDAGTTCSLFGLSLAGLAFLRRKVSKRLARA